MRLKPRIIDFVALFYCCILLELGNAAVEVEPIVTIGQGKLKGKVDVSRNGKSFAQYLGIPYMNKPERFQGGKGPPPKWDGIRDGTKFGSVCPQFDRQTKSVIGNENCLFLNVFTPQIANETKGKTTTTNSKSTIFHIHGGSFVSQSADLFGPKYLLDEDLILVTVNYRISVLGFISTGDNESVANLGLRDIIEALKWVKQNIQSFGGDSSKVTLFGGGSSGGALASYLMMSPLTKGLFSSVISSSGNALSPWAIVHNPRKVAEKLATKLNCPSNSTKSSRDIMACIKGKSLKDIEIARVALQGFTEDPAVPFAPVVETWLVGKDSFSAPVIPDAPEKLMYEGKYNKVPWLSGVNSLNGINLGLANILTTPKRLQQLDQDWSKLAPLIFHYSQTAPHPNNISDNIRAHYFGKKNISLETKMQLIDALTDRNFIYCTAKAASLQSMHSPVYLYYLDYSVIDSYSFLDEWGVKDKLNVTGMVHGDELKYIFNLKIGNFPLVKKGDKDFAFSDKMVKIWTAFAQTGKPMEMTEKAGAEWSSIPENTGKHGVQWYKLDSSTTFSRPIILDGKVQSTLWDEIDLGGYKIPSSPSKFAIGYEMSKNNPNPSPIRKSVTPIMPSISSSSVSTLTTKKPVHSGGVLKDDDPYSSTTTSTTTKKPGFFQKLVG